MDFLKCLVKCAAVGVALVSIELSGSSATAQEQEEPVQELDPIEVVDSSLALDGSAEAGYRSNAGSFGISGLHDLSQNETPFSVKSYSFDLLLNQNFDGLQDLSKVDSSVQGDFSNAGYYPSLNIRGFSLNNWSNYRLNGLMIVNQAQTGFENKEAIEIMKGLTGITAGFSAPGGIVNYVTKRPTEGALNDIHTTFNEYGNVLVHGDFSRRTEDGRLGVRVNAAGEELRSYVSQLHGDRQFGSVAVDFALTDSTDIFFDTELQHREQPVQPTIPVLLDGSIPSLPNPDRYLGQRWGNYSADTVTSSLRVDHRIDERWTFRVEANAMRLTRDDKSGFLDSLQPDGTADFFAYIAPDESREAVNTRVSALGQFETGPIGHQFATGVTTYHQRNRWSDSFYDTIGQTNIYDPVRLDLPETAVAPPSRVTGKRHERGLFVHDVAALTSQIDLHVGARHALVNNRNFGEGGEVSGKYRDDVITPSAAFVFKPVEGISTYVSYVEGLEQGGMAPRGTANQDQQLDPLVSEQIEVGVKAQLESITLETALFQIDRSAEFINGDNFYVQDGVQQHRGIEFSATGRVIPELTLVGSATFLDPTLDETGDETINGNTPVNVPKQRYALLGEYAPWGDQEWILTGSWSYGASRFVDELNTAEVGSFSVFSVGGRHQTAIASVPVTLRVNVENLTDARYWDSAGFGTLVQAAPRTVWGSMSVRF